MALQIIKSMNKQNLFSFNRLSFNFNFCLLCLALILSGCSTTRLQVNEVTKEKSKLPNEMKFAEEDADIGKETSCVITINDDSGSFLIDKDKISKDQLTDKVKKLMEGKTPDKRIVYLNSAESVKFATIVEVLNSIRKADIDKIGLVVLPEKEEKPGARQFMLKVKLPALPDEKIIPRPNPLTLVAAIDKNKNLLLNNEPMNNVSDPTSLVNRLTQVFKDREKNGVFREGTNEVEKTVFVKGSRSLNYGDVVRVINAVKGAGAEPIGLQIDDLTD